MKQPENKATSANFITGVLIVCSMLALLVSRDIAIWFMLFAILSRI